MLFRQQSRQALFYFKRKGAVSQPLGSVPLAFFFSKDFMTSSNFRWAWVQQLTTVISSIRLWYNGKPSVFSP